MDVLIALGTSVAYIYSVVVVFAPQFLPVGIDERGVYFEVSAVVIAFVLMGKYMEEIIKQRSSAAVRCRPKGVGRSCAWARPAVPARAAAHSTPVFIGGNGSS